MSEQNRMEKLISLAKRRGFIFQGSEIYGGLAGTWDYGPLGIELKRNIQALWWKRFVEDRPDMYGVDAAILMNPRVWEASGHVEGFHDPLVEDTKTKKRYRADHLLEDNGIAAESLSLEEMNAVIKEKGIMSPDGNPLGEVKQFNMMFKTSVGANEDSASVSYLRPETAQGMFVNFKNVLDAFRPKLPFGMAQIGKAFRNEITPRDFIFRVREFEQMEIEYFARESEIKSLYEEWKKEMWSWVESIGLDRDKVRWREHEPEERAHYSAMSYDIEYEYPFGGFKELYGLAYRTDYDLKKHIEHSGEKLEYRDLETNETLVPHVIEPTFGVERTILAVLDSAYSEEEVEGEERVVMKFAPAIAPIKVAILPLMRKDGLPECAMEIFTTLKNSFVCQYDETASIGKRYRRQDEIGTPYCVTVDYDSLEDDAATVRDRDTMEQERVDIAELENYFKQKLS